MSMTEDMASPERDAETVALFVEESLEGLMRVEQLLLDAEKGKPAPDLMATVFRDVHTIKGTSGYLAFIKIQALSHVAEDLLARLRDKKIIATPEHYACLLTVGDQLRKMIEHIRKYNSEGAVDIADVMRRLRGFLDDAPVAAAAPTPARATPAHDALPAATPAAAPVLVEKLSEKQVEPEAAETAAESATSARPDQSDGTVRVNVGLLDRLMNLIGELVLARNQVVQMVKVSGDANQATQAACQRLNLVTSDLQEQVMKTRMQPVARVFEKIPRMVRDLAKSMNKQVTTQIDGTATEIDKALVEAIRDPVMHIVRNAIDHGFESPEDRMSRGKSPTGRLSVRASHEGGMVTIEIADDGRGMDPQVLRAHAIRKQIITAADAERLSDREALELIFRPGFSTAAKVTDISGRGVGMDVVRTHVERAGGQAEIESVPGAGTTIRLKMPLTLAIIPALLASVGGQRFAIPQVNLLELVYLDEEQTKTAIEHVRGAAIYRLRGEILPIVRLGHVLGMETRPADPAGDQGTFVVVLAVGARRYGLIVDAIHDTEEIVIKPLHGQLKRISCYSGATVLGDGGVALILDVAGVAGRAGIDHQSRRRDDTTAAQAQVTRQPFIVFKAGNDHQCAVPLSMVARLEVIPTSTIERLANNEVVQYRNAIMPIVRPETVLPLGASPDERTEQPLIVFDFGHTVGMAVNEIMDVVELETDRNGSGGDDRFSLGETVIFKKTTLLIDVYAMVRQLAPDFIKERRRARVAPRLLLVDPSNTMRAALGTYLRARGFDLTDVASIELGLRELRSGKGKPYDAIITDLEDTFDCRELDVFQQERPGIPIFAWAYLDDEASAAHVVEAGARACVSKMKREDLMAALEANGLGFRRRATDRRAA